MVNGDFILINAKISPDSGFHIIPTSEHDRKHCQNFCCQINNSKSDDRSDEI